MPRRRQRRQAKPAFQAWSRATSFNSTSRQRSFSSHKTDKHQEADDESDYALARTGGPADRSEPRPRRPLPPSPRLLQAGQRRPHRNRRLEQRPVDEHRCRIRSRRGSGPGAHDAALDSPHTPDRAVDAARWDALAWARCSGMNPEQGVPRSRDSTLANGLPALRDLRAPARWCRPLGNRHRESPPYESQIQEASPDAASPQRPLFARSGGRRMPALKPMNPPTAQPFQFPERKRLRLSTGGPGHFDSIARTSATLD